jgi:hypothetical protein
MQDQSGHLHETLSEKIADPRRSAITIIRIGVVLLRRLDSRALGAEGPRAIVATWRHRLSSSASIPQINQAESIIAADDGLPVHSRTWGGLADEREQRMGNWSTDRVTSGASLAGRKSKGWNAIWSPGGKMDDFNKDARLGLRS